MTHGVGNYFFAKFVQSKGLNPDEADKIRKHAIIEYDKIAGVDKRNMNILEVVVVVAHKN